MIVLNIVLVLLFCEIIMGEYDVCCEILIDIFEVFFLFCICVFLIVEYEVFVIF